MAKNLKSIFKNVHAVCFDVDSTVIQQEAIDELAKFVGKFEEVSQITHRAMSGHFSFNEALKTRLNIIKPSIEQIRRFNDLEVLQLTPNIINFIDALRKNNIDIFLISGGFRCFIEPVATSLNIPHDHVYANRLIFRFDGSYRTFDHSELTAQNGGKARAIEKIKVDNPLYENIVMIGDGITDLEACPPAKYFIDKRLYFINDSSSSEFGVKALRIEEIVRIDFDHELMG